jgi:ferric-dicitrate binding protein FerR (iron transport regulator)
MSTTVPPRDGDLPKTPPSGTVLANEEALRVAFFAQYSALAAEARTALGDAVTLIPKVVEGAFVRAWDARQRLQTPAQLHDFLVDDVHHGAVRALSRRAAAHRMAGNGETHESAVHAAHPAGMNPDESWPHVLHAVRGEGHSQHVLDQAAAISRHEAAHHIVGATKESSVWKMVGLGALALVAILAIGYWIDHAGEDSSTASAVNAPDARIVSAAPAQIGLVTLDDGSTVRLAPDSKLSIPSNFGPKVRAVKLQGAGSFTIAKGVDREFRVYAGDAIVAATGTAFTVRHYAEDSTVTVVVTEGAVEVRGAKNARSLSAGSALVVAGKDVEARAASPDERDAADGWRTGILSITNRQLRDVLPQLKRWYNLDVKALDTSTLARTVTLRASLDSSRQAIRGVEKSTGLEFGYEGQAMVFREPGTAAKKK